MRCEKTLKLCISVNSAQRGYKTKFENIAFMFIVVIINDHIGKRGFVNKKDHVCKRLRVEHFKV